MNRRTFLKLASVVAGTFAVSGCTPIYNRLAQRGSPALTGVPPLNPGAFTALSRLTYGVKTEERQRVAEIGLAAWVEEQLLPDALEDSAAYLRIRRYETLDKSANELRDWQPGPLIHELQAATLLRQLYSRRQLYEVVAEFWSDHFNVSVEKEPCWFLKTVDDREVIRKHALGNFGDLLMASAKSPAMLIYLDNHANEKSHPNENYARELLELHTLGVDGNYSQRDVMELARCLTGWSVKEHFWYGDFVFKEELHDTGIKSVLGYTIQPAGMREAEQIIERLAHDPRTAHFLARKAVRRFLGDAPQDELVKRAATAFLNTKGDIRAMLRVILLDGVANPDYPLTPKYKRPLNFVTSALRTLNAEVKDPTALIQNTLVRMGQVPFIWAMPDGYPDNDEFWANNLLPRWQFAYELVQSGIDGVTVDLTALSQATHDPAALFDHLSLTLLGTSVAEPGKHAILESLYPEISTDPAVLPAILAAGVMVSPAFQWR
jgi:uncharacterized protein (DUF1800 family)